MRWRPTNAPPRSCQTAPEPPYNSGNAQYRQENFEEARSQYQQALVLSDPELAQRNVFNIGNALYSTTQFDEAIESYREALRLDPDDIDAKHNLELALLQIEQQREEAAEEPQDDPGQQPQDPQQRDQEPDPQDQQNDQNGQEPPRGQSESDQEAGQATDEPQPEPATAMTEDQARQLLEADRRGYGNVAEQTGGDLGTARSSTGKGLVGYG